MNQIFIRMLAQVFTVQKNIKSIDESLCFLHLIKSNKPQQLATNKMLRKLRSRKK